MTIRRRPDSDAAAFAMIGAVEAPNGPGGRTQSYGQDVRYGLLNPSITTPGDNCRGGSNPDRP